MRPSSRVRFTLDGAPAGVDGVLLLSREPAYVEHEGGVQVPSDEFSAQGDGRIRPGRHGRRRPLAVRVLSGRDPACPRTLYAPGVAGHAGGALRTAVEQRTARLGTMSARPPVQLPPVPRCCPDRSSGRNSGPPLRISDAAGGVVLGVQIALRGIVQGDAVVARGIGLDHGGVAGVHHLEISEDVENSTSRPTLDRAAPSRWPSAESRSCCTPDRPRVADRLQVAGTRPSACVNSAA